MSKKKKEKKTKKTKPVKEEKKVQKKKKPKRHVRWGIVLAMVFILALIVYLVTYPYRNDNKRLRDLGYSNETISVIREKDLLDTILDNGYYSKSLEQAINSGTLRKSYISLYTVITDRTPDETDFLLYRRLEDIGYEEDQLENLFANLKPNEITPLLVFDYQWDDVSYVEDVIACRGSEFDLSSDYPQMFRITKRTEDPGSVHALVNRTNYLSEYYAPNDIANISDEYSIGGSALRKEAADAAVRLIKAGQNAGVHFFISDSYWTYEDLQENYDSQSFYYTDYDMDILFAKPGFNEHQTGLSMNVAPTFEQADTFLETECYRWLREHAASYGFIERYPQDKTYITGRLPESSHWRYVGIATAVAVKQSELTYDEFYCLYLKGWENPELEPDQSILSEIDWYHISD